MIFEERSGLLGASENLLADLVDALVKVLRRLGPVEERAVTLGLMIFLVPLHGFVLDFITQRGLLDTILSTHLEHFVVAAEGDTPQLILIPLLARNRLDVAELVAADLSHVLVSAIFAHEGAEPQNSVRGLVLEAANAEFVERIFQHLLEVLLHCLGLLDVLQRRNVGRQSELSSLHVFNFFLYFLLFHLSRLRFH